MCTFIVWDTLVVKTRGALLSELLGVIAVFISYILYIPGPLGVIAFCSVA